MARHFADWLSTYVEYASYSEAPKKMHFWTGVASIAGALRRRVWIDMSYFKWTPNFYIILVAPPGIVSKSTTAAIGLSLLRKVPGVKFGPEVVTWPALVSAFADSHEGFEIGSDWHSQCALTLESSEFGNLINPQDREMIDLLVTLWDSRQGAFDKKTKHSGCDSVENPWINMIACTTPAWIAGNFPEYVIGGGFTSRCIFVYTDQKEKFVAYPHLAVPANMKSTAQKLVEDLESMSINLLGGYEISSAALDWGTIWYKNHYTHIPEHLADDRFGGYIARKQTHIHKLALVIAAARRETMTIELEDLIDANAMVTDLEIDLPKVFSKIGRTQDSIQSERFIAYIHRQGVVTYEQAWRYAITAFPHCRDLEGIITSAIRSGQISMETLPGKGMLLKRGK